MGGIVVFILLKRFRDDAAGATAIEYALIACIISISIVAGGTSIGQSLNEIFTAVNGGFAEKGP